MNQNYTAQILDNNPGASNAQAFFPQGDYLLDEDILKVHKRKKDKQTKKLKKQVKKLKNRNQLLALALLQCQEQASSFASKSSKKKKKKGKNGKKGKKNKQPKWLDEVLVQTLPPIIKGSFDRMLPPSQSHSVLALPDGRDYKH